MDIDPFIAKIWRKISWASPKNVTRNSMSQPQLPSPSQDHLGKDLSLTPRQDWSLSGKSNDSPSVSRSRPDRPFVGYRVWAPAGGFTHLYSISAQQNNAWDLRNVNEAKCGNGRNHVPAASDCECGFWALWTLEGARAYQAHGYIVGAILGWGRTQRHSYEGFRCQYAQIIGFALIVPNLILSPGLTVDTENLRRIQDTVGQYALRADVPLLGPAQLVQEASKQGIGYEESKELLK